MNVSKRIHALGADIAVWQRSYHDHIIRNENDYENIWRYIDSNVLLWKKDCFYKKVRSEIHCELFYKYFSVIFFISGSFFSISETSLN